MEIWSHIHDVIIPRLNPKTTISVDRDITLKELGDKVIPLIMYIKYLSH